MGEIVTVDFHGDQLFGFRREDGDFIALRPIVEAMKINWSGQLQRLRRNPILSEGVCVMHTPFPTGGGQEVVCLRLNLMNGWLMTIDVNRIEDDEARAKVLDYQREGYDVLYRHFHGVAKAEPERIATPRDDGQAHEPDGTKLRAVTEARQTFGTKASGQLWFKLGLPLVPAMMEQRRQLDLLDYERIKTAGDATA